jgi:hypothetical protein
MMRFTYGLACFLAAQNLVEETAFARIGVPAFYEWHDWASALVAMGFMALAIITWAEGVRP